MRETARYNGQRNERSHDFPGPRPTVLRRPPHRRHPRPDRAPAPAAHERGAGTRARFNEALRTGDAGDVQGDVRAAVADLRRGADDAMDAGFDAAMDSPGWAAGTSPGFGQPDPLDAMAARIGATAKAAAGSSASPKQQQRRVARAEGAAGHPRTVPAGHVGTLAGGGETWHVRVPGRVGRPGAWWTRP